MNVVENYQHGYKCQKDNNPSFSSSLLDVIYRSIDEIRVDDHHHEHHHSYNSMLSKKTMVIKQQQNCLQVEKQMNMYRRHHHHENAGSKTGNIINNGSPLETETIYGFHTRPTPIRTTTTTTTTTSAMFNNSQQNNDDDAEVKNKSRAMKKIYGYLKRGKQLPLSPRGGRLASFLVSLFTTTKTKSSISSPCTGRYDEVVVFHNNIATTRNPMSISSSVVSGSLMTLAPPRAAGKSSSNGDHGRMKKTSSTVRFSYPAGNDSQPAARDENGDRFDDNYMADSRIRDNRCILNNYKYRTRNLVESCYEKKKKKKVGYLVDDSIKNNNVTTKEDEEEEEEETGSSSDDLFELDHLSAIGIDDDGDVDECGMQELPLYETTSVAANRAIAIANGFLV